MARCGTAQVPSEYRHATRDHRFATTPVITPVRWWMASINLIRRPVRYVGQACPRWPFKQRRDRQPTHLTSALLIHVDQSEPIMDPVVTDLIPHGTV
jgi:hypothetical protein